MAPTRNPLRTLAAVLMLAAAGTSSSLMAKDPVNVALNKPTRISSLSPWSRTYSPTGANDGLKNGGFGFHTGDGGSQWWEVDLGQNFRLSKVIVYNRTDGWSERATNLKIMHSTDRKSWSTAPRTAGPFNQLTVDMVTQAGAITARYVRLQLDDGNPLHLEEVEVFDMPEEVSFGLPGFSMPSY